MRRILIVVGVVISVLVMDGGRADAVYPSSTRAWNVTADGNITPQGVDCLTELAHVSCLIESSGDVWGTGVNSGTSHAKMLYKLGHPASGNGQGGRCAYTGINEVTLSLDGGTLLLTMPDSMLVCEIGETRLNAPHSFTGSYAIVSGTGKYAGASGSGVVKGGDDGYGYWHANFRGSIARPTTRTFKATLDGTMRSASLQCLSQPNASCEAAATGDAWGSFIDRGSAVASIWYRFGDAVASNGQGGRCAQTGPNTVILNLDGDTLVVSLTPADTRVCEVGKTRPNAPHVLTGSFVILSGSGRLAGAAGSGKVTGGDDGHGYLRLLLNGTITY